MTDIYQICHKLKNRLEREIKEHSVPDYHLTIIGVSMKSMMMASLRVD